MADLSRKSSESSGCETSVGMLRGMKQGDSDGWKRFVHLYTPMIYSWCRRAGLQEADAADVTQEVFRSVSRGVNGLKYGGQGNSFRGWLWTITRHELSKFFKRHGDRTHAVGGSGAAGMLTQVPDWVTDEECPVDDSAESEVVRRAAELIRSDFEEHTWQAFWLSAVEELSTPEIVKRLDMTPGAVRQAKFRVLARLREFVGFV